MERSLYNEVSEQRQDTHRVMSMGTDGRDVTLLPGEEV